MTLELIAISKALAYAGNNNWDKVIYSDSKSAIRHLARCVSGYGGVPTAFCVLPQLLQYELRNVQVKYQWIPAHIEIYGNEEAEKLANTTHFKAKYALIMGASRLANVMEERDFLRDRPNKGV
ncbi:hypothetical protein EVAR_38623_1 [Eumeta japonica]|uniref:RNase H type-1 domain-containing protein n=1 Tax=Eumeta variegata TaxID=151549 RepID=A0A4C1WTJ0_EUMVA|nr:hypothetical protein EVAR_38623_1 [Eumeta japonica]